MKRGRVPLLALAAGAVLAAGLALTTPGTTGGFIAQVVNSADTAGTAPYFHCLDAADADAPSGTSGSFVWPLNEASGSTTAADSSGHSASGSYQGSMATAGSASAAAPLLCPRDSGGAYSTTSTSTYVIRSSTSSFTATRAFSLEIWFKTASTTGGMLMGFGNGTAGSTSTISDRVIYLNSSGNLVFGLNPTSGAKTLASPGTYDDGQWHDVIVTFNNSVAPVGTTMYVDGAKVNYDSSMTQGAASSSYYWRVGYDNLSACGWSGTTASTSYINGWVRFAALYNSKTLNQTQVTHHYTAGS